MDIGNRDVFTKNLRVAFRKIGKSFVLVNLEDNRILRLNETGSEIWGSLDGRDLEGVAERVHALFDAPGDVVMADTKEFLELLLSRGLVERRSAG
jgi:hypothetical protein